MTRTADDARYRPRPGDTRTDPSRYNPERVVTRVCEWAVEHNNAFLDGDLEVESLEEWSRSAYRSDAGVTWTPKARTAEDARFDPLPGDTRRVVLSPSEVAYARVVTRDGDSVEVQVDTSVGGWSLDFWAGGGLGDVWTPAS